MSDFSNYNFAPNDPCIIEGRLVQLWRPRVFVELHYITLHYLFISTKIFTLGSVLTAIFGCYSCKLKYLCHVMLSCLSYKGVVQKFNGLFYA